MALGMEMLLQGMGVDPAALQQNVNNAVAHVAKINENIGGIAQRLGIIEQAVGVILGHTTVTSATTLRIEDAVNKLRSDAPDNSVGFVESVQEFYPNAAQEMQAQIEGTNDARTNTGHDAADQPTKYVNGNAN